MDKTNFEFLCDDMRFTGFGDGLQQNLEKEMATGKSEIELYFAHEIGQDPVQAILYFSKPDPTGYYFFKKYKLFLFGNYQWFTLFKGRGVTVKEGYNLLCGRAVFKQLPGRNGQLYNTWLQLDLSVKEADGYKVDKYYESHGFDLSKALGELTVETPSSNWDFSMMLRSLERGNLQAAFLKEDGSNTRVYLAANPKEKNILIHTEIVRTEKSIPGESHDDLTHAAGDDIENALRKKPIRKTAF